MDKGIIKSRIFKTRTDMQKGIIKLNIFKNKDRYG